MELTPDLRVSDAERDEVAAQLRRHTVDGRLTTGEFADRLDEVYAAKTRRDLDATLRELPTAPPAPPAPRRQPPARPSLPGPLAPAGVIAAVLVGIWALSGFGYFWPMWPLLFWVIPMALGTRACGARGGQGHTTNR